MTSPSLLMLCCDVILPKSSQLTLSNGQVGCAVMSPSLLLLCCDVILPKSSQLTLSNGQVGYLNQTGKKLAPPRLFNCLRPRGQLRCRRNYRRSKLCAQRQLRFPVTTRRVSICNPDSPRYRAPSIGALQVSGSTRKCRLSCETAVTQVAHNSADCSWRQSTQC